MGHADTERALEIADKLRASLDLPPPALLVQAKILQAYAEGFRRGWWDRDEYDKLQETASDEA